MHIDKGREADERSRLHVGEDLAGDRLGLVRQLVVSLDVRHVAVGHLEDLEDQPRAQSSESESAHVGLGQFGDALAAQVSELAVAALVPEGIGRGDDDSLGWAISSASKQVGPGAPGSTSLHENWLSPGRAPCIGPVL